MSSVAQPKHADVLAKLAEESKGGGHPLRLAILISHPIQYFVPVFRALAAREDIDLIVIFHSRVGVDEYFDEGFGRRVRWDIPLLDGYRHVFLSRSKRIGGLKWSVLATLARARLDVLVMHGYSQPTNVLALFLCKILGIEVLLRGDSNSQIANSTQSPVKRWMKQRLIGVCDGYLAIGSDNREYYLQHGARPEEIFHVPFCVDNQNFALPPGRREASRASLREQWRVDERDVVLLFASKMTPRKRACDLLEAFMMIGETHRAWLVFAGDGDEELLLRSRASEAASKRVLFIGFKNQSELPGVYAACDIFILPSSAEPWGLVVNEVMAAGLPVIVTDEVGAGRDLVAGQDTGIVYPCGDLLALAQALQDLITHPSLRRRMGRKARQVIAAWDVSVCADTMAQAASITSRR